MYKMCTSLTFTETEKKNVEKEGRKKKNSKQKVLVS